MSLFGSDINKFLEHCRKLIQKDWDNVMLIDGVEGTGKTTWAMQLGKALDPEGFPGEPPGLERIQFPHDAFLKVAANAPRGAAVLWDEGRLHKRRAMHGTTLDVLDFLQDCRALNLHLLICFPHELQLDNAVKDHRIRYRFNIPRRGLAELYVRRQKHQRLGASQFYWHKTGDRFKYGPNKGPIHQAYKAKKEAHMRRKAMGIDDDEDPFATVDVASILLKDKFHGSA